MTMKRLQPLTLISALIFTGPALLGCNANLGSDGSSDTGDTGEAGEGGDGDDFFPCSANNPCPDGQFCFNGLCAIGCLSDDDCADNQYCGTETDQLCHAVEVPTCSSDDECASSQVCVNGYCSAIPEDTGCNLDDYLNDGCASNAVCLEDLDNPDQGVCYEMPACSADNTCPTGLQGAICNNGYLENKDPICLLGMCDTTANCPADWSCVRFGAEVLGLCSDGSFGMPCASEADCISGICMTLPGLDGGFCQ